MNSAKNKNSSKPKTSLPLTAYNLKLIGLSIALVVCALDLASKYLAFNFLDGSGGGLEDQSRQFVVTGFFNLVQVWNKGVSFGMFNWLRYGKYIILGVNIAIVIVLIIWLTRTSSLYLSIALGFIIGGAFGNIIDRIINGGVADFLDFHAFGYHWPAFNLADSAVFLGVFLLLMENYFVQSKPVNSKEDKKNISKNEK
ncbi:MAG: signal peptidase II [Rickettsiales bacterium]|jgi:signal peptidase II